jgi:predicted ABC-type ATPase
MSAPQASASPVSDPHAPLATPRKLTTAEEVKLQLARDYPPGALAWVDDLAWTKGPVQVPTRQLDRSDPNWKLAAADKRKIASMVSSLRSGARKPVVAVRRPGTNLLRLVDGHSRSLASIALGRPVTAWVGTAKTASGPWDAVHKRQAAAKNLAGEGTAIGLAWDEALHPRGFHGKFAKGGGTFADSLEQHTRDGQLTPERAALHEKIIGRALAGTSPSHDPVATFMGGGPASGKSAMLKQSPVSGVVIDPDAIKAQLPEYQTGVAAGDKGAAAFVHEESSALAKKIMSRAVAGKRDFTLDGTGDSSYPKLAGKAAEAKAAGYRVHGQYVTADTATAAGRADQRAAKTGRVVPLTYLRETHASVTGAFRQAVKNGLFDSAELWDNNDRPDRSIHLIGSKPAGGDWSVQDKKAWARFLAKEHERFT